MPQHRNIVKVAVKFVKGYSTPLLRHRNTCTPPSPPPAVAHHQSPVFVLTVPEEHFSGGNDSDYDKRGSLLVAFSLPTRAAEEN
jgi:hypothetical protein